MQCNICSTILQFNICSTILQCQYLQYNTAVQYLQYNTAVQDINMNTDVSNGRLDTYLTLDIRRRKIHKVCARVVAAAISTAHQTCQHTGSFF
jgi:hypothetical protein